MSLPSIDTAASVAVIGGGNMARALVSGLLKRGWPADAIAVAEPLPAARDALARDFGVAVHADNMVAAGAATTWVLAVKPQSLPEVCAGLAALAQARRPLVVSIAAGATTAQLGAWLGEPLAIVRCMPNLPAMIGAGATGLIANGYVSPAQAGSAQALLGALGTTHWLTAETQMDAVTALSGTGPAYLFLLAEAMQAAGEAQGLAVDTARALTVETLHGAARLLAESTETPATLRERVTSPGGTTAAAMEVFAARGFHAVVAEAIAAAERRAGGLSAALRPADAAVSRSRRPASRATGPSMDGEDCVA